ncbi:MAG: hypothetical protein H6R15_1424 [Proteobacteria bacterium]|nr:hypothetical protein [Pseudomonadota bacterium]
MPLPAASLALPESPLAAARQLLVVLAPSWASTGGSLQRFARNSAIDEWRAIGAAIPVSLGRAGLGWGIGRHRGSEMRGPRKREGDGRAPAGLFAISELFGTADRESPFARSARLPYRCTSRDLKAIDAPLSKYYNRLVEHSALPDRDWTSHEEMRRDDERYVLGAVIAHNSEPPVAGAGSCIFLHVWPSPGAPTAGCTAAARADVETICGWLDSAAGPLLVQLPEAEYRRRKAAWALP